MKVFKCICLPNIVFVFVMITGSLEALKSLTRQQQCLPSSCPNTAARMVCGYDSVNKKYLLLKSKCHMAEYAACYGVEMKETPILFCVRNDASIKRRSSDDSCPIFCPEHYSPVCGASKLRDYKYRSFRNGCFLDMLNCRAEDEYSGYVEVPLSYCQRHGMRNIYKEQVIVYNSPLLQS